MSIVLATWGLLGFIAIASIAVLGLATLNIVEQRGAVLADGRKDTVNLAHSLKQHAELTFRTADALLSGIVERLEHDDLDPSNVDRLKSWFRQETLRSSQFLSFAIIDNKGSLIVTSATDDAPNQLSDCDFFIYHQTHDDSALHIGRPVRGRAEVGWFIPLTRRVNRPDGSFGGVAVAAVDPKHFQDFYDSLDIGKNGAILLASLDGPLLVRRPFVEANVGRDMSSSGIFKQLKLSPAGSIEITASTDGLTRLNSYEQDEAYPIVVAFARDVDDMLTPWHQYAMRRAVEAISIVVLMSLLGIVVWRATRNLKKNSSELKKKNGQFDAALTSMSNGLSMFDADGKLVVWNDRYIELYGMSSELIQQGTSINAILEHRKSAGDLQFDVGSYVAELRQSLIDCGKGSSCSKLSDGRVVFVTNTATPDGGWVGIHDDITNRVQSEREIFDQATELARTNMRFEAALGNMTLGFALFDADKRLVIANSRLRQMYDLPEELVRSGTPLLLILQDHIDRGVFGGLTLDEQLRSSATMECQYILSATGRETLIRRSPTADGGWVATHEDVTEQRRQERLIAEKAAEIEIVNARFDAALSNMAQGISMFDKDKRLVVWNNRFAEIYRLPQSLLKAGTHVNDFMADLVARGILMGANDQFAIDAKIASMNELSADTSRVEEFADGSLILVSRKPTADGGWLASHEDITERRRAEAEIARLARHDVLTGLANRAEFNAKLQEASKRVKRYGGTITVMMIDLDKFKAINDTLGHPAGDKLLIEVAQRLKSALRETDLLARLGGDEFAIIQEGGTTQHEGAIALALRIIHSITRPFDLDGHQASVGASIGIALSPEHGVDPEDLLKRADLALYAVKAGGRNDFRIFQPEMLEAAHTQHTAESELRDAIDREEFVLHYQPVMDAKTLRLCGVEALVRWRHPTRGLIGPDQFIPLAESTGLILPLGDWVLQRACADAASWPTHIRVAVNVSAVQFEQGNLFDVILCTLVETGLAPNRLELEITETVLLKNQEAHLANIRQLKNLGISIALDDFGTGYSSMGYLTIFPFDKIKIDKSFTQGALDRRECNAVVASTVALAQGLGAVTTAEGVETEDQLECMRQAGVNLVQGYLFGRPVPVSQLYVHDMSLAHEMVA